VDPLTEFFEEFVFPNRDAEGVLAKLVDRAANEYPRRLKKRLKSNKEFWRYLTK
jgi:hypothetical protein